MWLCYRGGSKGNGNTRMSRSVLIETPKSTSSTIRTETVLIWYFNTNYSTIYSPNDLPAADADAAAAIAPSLSPEQTSSEFLLLNPTVQIHPPLSPVLVPLLAKHQQLTRFRSIPRQPTNHPLGVSPKSPLVEWCWNQGSSAGREEEELPQVYKIEGKLKTFHDRIMIGDHLFVFQAVLSGIK